MTTGMARIRRRRRELGSALSEDGLPVARGVGERAFVAVGVWQLLAGES